MGEKLISNEGKDLFGARTPDDRIVGGKMTEEYVRDIIGGTYLQEIIEKDPKLLGFLVKFNKDVLFTLALAGEEASSYIKQNPNFLSVLVYANADLINKIVIGNNLKS